MEKVERTTSADQLGTRLQQPLTRPEKDILNTLTIMGSKLSVVRHSLSVIAENGDDNILFGLLDILDEVQNELSPLNDYLVQVENVIFPLWKNLQVLYPAGVMLFEEMAELDHDELIQRDFLRQIYNIREKREKAAAEKGVAQ